MTTANEVKHLPQNVRITLETYTNLTYAAHFHSECELVYVREGLASAFIREKSYTLKKGDLVFISPDDIHFIDANEDSVLSFIVFDNNIVKSITSHKYLNSPLLAQSYNFTKIYDKISEELNTANNLCTQSIANRIERLILDIFSNEFASDVLPQERKTHSTNRRILQLIERNYAFFSLHEAATSLRLNQSYISVCFNKHVGVPFSSELNRVRIMNSLKMLLAPDKKMVTEIAIDCGFETIRNFNRMFRRYVGCSPSLLPEGFAVSAAHSMFGIQIKNK